MASPTPLPISTVSTTTEVSTATFRRHIPQLPKPLPLNSRGEGAASVGNIRNRQCLLAVGGTRTPSTGGGIRRSSPNTPHRRPICRATANGNGSFPVSSSPEPSSVSSPSGLVFGGAAATGSWDSWEVGSPVVKRFVRDDGERWLMWYRGRSGKEEGDSIGLAQSSDGIHWERASDSSSIGDVAPVIRPGEDWWAFDTAGVRPAEVLVMSSDKLRDRSSIYWMYYTGFSAAGAAGSTDHLRLLPGLAISQDGTNWARIEGGHHSGALFDGGDEDSSSLDSTLSISSPCVVLHRPGDLRMYYQVDDPRTGRSALRLARSRDGVEWVHLGVVEVDGGGMAGGFDECGAACPSVVRDRADGGYVMAYEGVDSRGRRSVGLARSVDGLKNWKRWGGRDTTAAVAVLGPSEMGGWDEGGIGSPCLVQMDRAEDWRLYYSGFSVGKRTRIGLAVLEADGFRRWGAVQLQQQP